MASGASFKVEVGTHKKSVSCAISNPQKAQLIDANNVQVEIESEDTIVITGNTQWMQVLPPAILEKIPKHEKSVKKLIKGSVSKQITPYTDDINLTKKFIVVLGKSPRDVFTGKDDTWKEAQLDFTKTDKGCIFVYKPFPAIEDMFKMKRLTYPLKIMLGFLQLKRVDWESPHVARICMTENASTLYESYIDAVRSTSVTLYPETMLFLSMMSKDVQRTGIVDKIPIELKEYEKIDTNIPIKSVSTRKRKLKICVVHYPKVRTTSMTKILNGDIIVKIKHEEQMDKALRLLQYALYTGHILPNNVVFAASVDANDEHVAYMKDAIQYIVNRVPKQGLPYDKDKLSTIFRDVGH